MGVKICVSGRMATGKSTLAAAIHQLFGFEIVSFGNIIRNHLQTQSIPITRENMHKLSEHIVAEYKDYGAMDWFIKNSSEIVWENSLIVEGCRHPDTYKRMTELFPESCILIHCTCSEETQIQRIMSRDNISRPEALKMIDHPVENGHDETFARMADIVMNEQMEQNIVLSMLQKLTNA